MKWLKRLLNLLPCVILTALASVILGIILLSKYQAEEESHQEKVIDYTDCEKVDDGIDTGESISCKDFKRTRDDSCTCYIAFNLTDSMDGNIILYYELDSFDQTRSEYVNSKDSNQLQGILSPTPSVDCEPYAYEDTDKGRIPIAPCGRIADTMFSDYFTISNGSMILNFQKSGMLTEADKMGFKNPTNIQATLKDFAKPKSWKVPIWQFDNDPENNGFQNEVFIGWMKTEWKRKPYSRLLQDGLPSGEYLLQVAYNYPPSTYDGRRKCIFVATKSTTVVYQFKYVIGIISLIIGFILAAMATSLIFMRKKIMDISEKRTDTNEANENTANGNRGSIPAEEAPLSASART